MSQPPLPPRPTVDLAVSGIGVISSRGTTPVAAGATPRAVPGDGWFDHRAELGPRGYKYLPAASHYLLAATKRALADAGDDFGAAGAEARGVAVGTNSAASALHAAMDRTVIETSADDLSPATAPFFSINLIGSRLATEHALEGFNVTVTSPRVAGLEAVQIGTRSVALGRASWLLAGATEAPLDEAEPGYGRSEAGAAALVLEPVTAIAARGGRAYGRCRVRTLFFPPAVAASAGGPARAAQLARTAFADLGLEDGPPVIRAVLDASPVGAALAAALGPEAIRVQPGAGCLEPLLQVVGALAGQAQECVVVTAAAEGNVAVARLTRTLAG